jgi:UDP-glucose:(heptosyl)LPS alpha-1,3-glucosyltransferase
MRVTLAVRYFHPKGGAEKFTRNLAQHLVSRGHRVRVICLKSQPMDGVEIVGLGMPRLVWHPMRAWITGGRIARALRSDAHDVVFAEQKVWGGDVMRPGGGVEVEYWNEYLAYRYFPRRMPRGTLYLQPKWWFDRLCERRVCLHPGLRRVIVNSAMIRDELIRNYPRLAGRITVIHNGVERRPPAAAHADRQAVLAGAGLAPDGLTAIFVGQEFLRKGLAHAIAAVARARERDPAARVQLLVVGQGKVEPFRKLADSLGVRGAVAFIGGTDRPGVFYAASDVLILPTYYDPFANVTLEALQFGLPVITTRRNGGSGVLEAGRTGWIANEPDDVEAMAGWVLELRDADRRAAMGRAAAAAAGEHRLEDRLAEVEAVLAAEAERGAGRDGRPA